MNTLRRMAKDLVALAGFIALLFAVYLLPPDTSLSQVQRAGILRACTPTVYPPLVTVDAAAPGIDIELLRAMAAELRVDLIVSGIPAIGRDFNPRSWGVTRAQCEVIAGGVVNSPTTRSFLEVTPSYAATGWAAVTKSPVADWRGKRVGVFVGVSGLDRLALSSLLRARGAEIAVSATAADLLDSLAAGRIDLAVTELLLARQLAAQRSYRVELIADGADRRDLAFGLWKGDLTLKRAMVSAFETIEGRGEVARVLARYLGPS